MHWRKEPQLFWEISFTTVSSFLLHWKKLPVWEGFVFIHCCSFFGPYIPKLHESATSCHLFLLATSQVSLCCSVVRISWWCLSPTASTLLYDNSLSSHERLLFFLSFSLSRYEACFCASNKMLPHLLLSDSFHEFPQSPYAMSTIWCYIVW